MRSRNQLAKAAFSAGSDAAGLGAHRTPEKPGPQTNLLPALARAKPQTGQGHLEVSRNCELDLEIVIGGGFTAMLKPCYTRGVLAKNVHTVTSASLGVATDAELKL